MGRAHLIKGVGLPLGKQAVSLNLTLGHVLTYLKRFPIPKKTTAKHQQDCQGPIRGNSLRHSHHRHWEQWNTHSSLRRVTFPEVSQSSDKHILPGVSWFRSIIGSCSTSDLAQRNTGARASQPFDQDRWDQWSDSQSWSSATITTGKRTFHFEWLQIAPVSPSLLNLTMTQVRCLVQHYWTESAKNIKANINPPPNVILQHKRMETVRLKRRIAGCKVFLHLRTGDNVCKWSDSFCVSLWSVARSDVGSEKWFPACRRLTPIGVQTDGEGRGGPTHLST